MRILVCESDALLAAFLRDALELEGHTIEVAADANAMRRLAAAGGWDLFIVDGGGASHTELLPPQRALFQELSAQAPVLATSAHTWASRVTAAEIGVAAILIKPYDLDALYATVQAIGRGGGSPP